MPVDQILSSDGGDGFVFGHARIWLYVVHQFATPGTLSTSSLRREMASEYCRCTSSSLSLRNSGPRSKSSKTLNTSSKSAFRQDHEMVVELAFLPGLSTLAARISKIVVQLIAGLGFCAAGSPDVAVHIDQAGLVHG